MIDVKTAVTAATVLEHNKHKTKIKIKTAAANHPAAKKSVNTHRRASKKMLIV